MEQYTPLIIVVGTLILIAVILPLVLKKDREERKQLEK